MFYLSDNIMTLDNRRSLFGISNVNILTLSNTYKIDQLSQTVAVSCELIVDSLR